MPGISFHAEITAWLNIRKIQVYYKDLQKEFVIFKDKTESIIYHKYKEINIADTALFLGKIKY